MTEQLISFETAQLMHELGIELHYSGGLGVTIYNDEGKLKTTCLYDRNTILVTSQSLLCKWIREKLQIEVLVYCNASGWMWELNKAYYTGSLSGGTHIRWSDERGPNAAAEWETYEEALEDGLQMALNMYKNKS